MATIVRDENQDEDEERKHDTPVHQHAHSGSFRILGGGFPTPKSPHLSIRTQSSSGPADDDNDGEEDDPMAWADLEAFGGTKKTLKRPPRKLQLSPEDVRQQLEELHVLDRHMDAATPAKHSRQGMLDTIAWLKKHHREHHAELDQNRRSRSASMVRAVLGMFRSANGSKKNQAVEEEDDNDSDAAFVPLESPWGQAALECPWTDLGFALLNTPIVDDMQHVRHVIECKELLTASSQAVIALAKWLQRFDRHVAHTITFKEYLLDERAVIADVGCKVTTVYDQYAEALAVALKLIHGDRQDLSDAILRMFEELEDVLNDELAAVREIVAQTMTEAEEYMAISKLFHHLMDDETGGIVLAMLLGWMKNHMETAEVGAFLALFDADVKDKIAGEWMRHYATYLELLEEFSINFESSMAFFT